MAFLQTGFLMVTTGDNAHDETATRSLHQKTMGQGDNTGNNWETGIENCHPITGSTQNKDLHGRIIISLIIMKVADLKILKITFEITLKWLLTHFPMFT